jgi:hypothetical protein
VDPRWTRGHAFSVAIEVLEPEHGAWRVAVADGLPVRVEAVTKRPWGADAEVRLTRRALEHLVAGSPAPPGERPVVRGDRAAAGLLRAWIDRARVGGA